jgi:hypothetical protein
MRQKTWVLKRKIDGKYLNSDHANDRYFEDINNATIFFDPYYDRQIYNVIKVRVTIEEET